MLTACKVEGCARPHYKSGYCGAHHARRARYGDPLAGRTYRGDLPDYLNNVVLPYDGDECLLWPFTTSREGYGKIHLNGRAQTVTRIVCADVHGPAPTPKHHAAHECGKGHLGCVTKKHLSWKTAAENALDRFEHGTVLQGENAPGAKLTEEQVHQIRALKGVIPQWQIAKRFGVKRNTIYSIQAKLRWASLPDREAA